MSSMLLCSAGAGDAASAMVQARECGEHRNLATRLNTVNPRKTARMDLNKHEHAGYKSMINRILCSEYNMICHCLRWSISGGMDFS
jgi:hypothetical protein